MTSKNIKIALVVTILIVAGYFYFNGGVSLGGNITGQIHRQSEQFVQGLMIGDRSTLLTGAIGSTCNLIASDGSQAASTTVAYDCAVTGMTSSYQVVAQLATSTPRNGVASPHTWTIDAAKASSTSGYVTILLRNSGPAASPSITGVGSSTVIWAFKTN